MTLVDSHCHLDDGQFNADRDAVVERALAAGVATILTIGTGDGPPDLEAALRQAEKHPQVLATVGIHPQYVANAAPEHLKVLEGLLRHRKCVALGEIGLDYHWEPYDKDRQMALFRDQLQIARDARKPVVIHTRDSWQDTMEVLREHWVPTGLPCVMHCFTGNAQQALQALDLGFHISIAGVVTYPKAVELREAVALIPADRLLVETDAPYLPPVPYQGKRNEPAFILRTAEKVAELRGQSLADLASGTSENFQSIFSAS